MNISKNKIIAGIFAIAGMSFFVAEKEKESQLEWHNQKNIKPPALCHQDITLSGKKLHCISPPVETPDAVNL